MASRAAAFAFACNSRGLDADARRLPAPGTDDGDVAVLAQGEIGAGRLQALDLAAVTLEAGLNRAGKIRPGHRGGGLRHGLHARLGRRAQLFQAAMMAITAKGMAANTPMAAYSSGSAAKPPALSSAAMAR